MCLYVDHISIACKRETFGILLKYIKFEINKYTMVDVLYETRITIKTTNG